MSFNMWSVAENKLRCNKCPIFHSFQAPKKEKFFFSFFHFEKVLKAVARHLNWVLPSTWRRAIRTNKLFPKAFLSAPNKFDKKFFKRLPRLGENLVSFGFPLFSLSKTAH